MGKFKKSQILMLTLLAALLFVTPLLSSSLRPMYLYFIFNLLIISLSAEAGLLSAAFSKPLDNEKKHSSISPDNQQYSSSDNPSCNDMKKKKKVEKSASEKIVINSSDMIKSAEKVKKCPSTPSLFFISSGEAEFLLDDHQDFVEDEEEIVGEISGQELFTKAETFIGNFYKQLKMQREESWKRIHGFYQKSLLIN